MQEKNLRLQREEEIMILRQRMDLEAKTIRAKVEEEYRNNFNLRQKGMHTAFAKETSELAE